MSRMGVIILFYFQLTGSLSYCQDWKNLDLDELFKEAREESFEGQLSSAREKLTYILNKTPDYYDVEVFLARTYAWDKNYDSAKYHLQNVISKDPKNKEAISTYVDVYTWESDLSRALDYVTLGLKYYPTNVGLLMKKASIQNLLGEHTDAITTLNHILSISPSNSQALALRNQIKSSQLRYKVQLKTGIDLFSKNFDPAFNTSLSLSRNNDWGLSLLRFNYARRFNINGVQGEIDLYPILTQGVYAYINYGYSQSFLFPEHRFGAELFSRIPENLEGSLGIRYLAFDSPVLIYTGSLSWYHKRLLLSVRPYLSSNRSTGLAMSGTFKGRYYLNQPKSYIELLAGLGYSPDLRTFQTTNGISVEEIYNLQSQAIGGAIYHQLNSKWAVSAKAELTRQELISDVDNFIYITRTLLGLSYNF